MRSSLNSRPDPRSKERVVAIALFAATALSLLFAHFVWWGAPGRDVWGKLVDASLFTIGLLFILLAHEFGHYFMAKYHGFRLSLPLFIPMPYMLGTLGAIIALRERPTNRVGLAEMGIAGPLAGLAGILVVLSGSVWIGESLEVDGQSDFSTPLLFWLMGLVTGGNVGVSGSETPLAMAAWLGCLVTSFNLLPFGQLDGGHVSAAASPQSTLKVGRVMLAMLVLGGLFWFGWIIWAALLTLFVSTKSVELRDYTETHERFRVRLVVFITMIVMALVFHPVPFLQIPGLVEVIRGISS